MSNTEENIDIVKEHFDILKKRQKAYEMPFNNLTRMYIESLGESTIEKRLRERFENMDRREILNLFTLKDSEDK